MNAILAIIAVDRQTIVVIDIEAVEIIFFFFILLILLKHFDGSLGLPLLQRLPGVRYVCPSNPYRWRGKRLIMVGMFVCQL
jgi:hypothetical protein